MKRSKRYIDNASKIDLNKDYSLEQALDFLASASNTKFDQTVDLCRSKTCGSSNKGNCIFASWNRKRCEGVSDCEGR